MYVCNSWLPGGPEDDASAFTFEGSSRGQPRRFSAYHPYIWLPLVYELRGV